MEEKKPLKNFIIREDVANALLGYLAAKPYAEVGHLAPLLQMLQEAPKPCECPDGEMEYGPQDDAPEVEAHVEYDAVTGKLSAAVEVLPEIPDFKSQPLSAEQMMAKRSANETCFCGEVPCVCLNN